MGKALKTIIFLVFLILLNSCAANVNFVYKKPIPELKADLYEEPQVCIAILSNDITDIKDSLKNDFGHFAGKTVYLHDITNELVLSDDRRIIMNYSEITMKYPIVRYLIVFYQNAPQISHHFFTRSETEQHINKDGSIETRSTGYDIMVYVTKFRAVCDTILFDLRNNDLIAQASDTFTNQDRFERRELFPDHTLLGMLSDIISKPKDRKESYPNIKRASASSMHKYFYTFLNNVSNSKVKDKKGT